MKLPVSITIKGEESFVGFTCVIHLFMGPYGLAVDGPNREYCELRLVVGVDFKNLQFVNN